MAVPLNINWNAVKRAFVEGVSPADICASFGLKSGTLAARANRYGWLHLRKAAELVQDHKTVGSPEVMELATIVANEAGQDLQKRGWNMLQALADDAERTIDRLNRRAAPKTDREEEVRERTLKMVAERVKTCTGLTDQAVPAFLVVGRISAAARQMQELQRQQEAVEVEAVSTAVAG